MSIVTSPFPENLGLQKPVCIFCGSSMGNNTIYANSAKFVAEALARERIPIIYGGGRLGIMGVVSEAALDAGGYVHGIIPNAMLASSAGIYESGSQSPSGEEQKEKGMRGAGTLVVHDDVRERLTMEIVGTMHERKLKMAELATGGFIVLPGGYGTFEEMLEMVTWNQLGIHNRPVLCLCINKFYTSLEQLIQQSVEAGFIKQENANLLQMVHLDGAPEASQHGRSSEWGPVTIEALKNWTYVPNAGFGFDWNKAQELEEYRKGKASLVTASIHTYPALFTTLRHTPPSCADEAVLLVEKSHIPMLDEHIDRLREAHAHFRKRDGSNVWDEWEGDEAVWRILHTHLESICINGQGDWRVRITLHPKAGIEIQVVPVPDGIGPFRFLPSSRRSEKVRPIVLDPENTDTLAESEVQKDFRLYKTTERGVYDAASRRGAVRLFGLIPPEVLLHTDTHILETTTSNIALHLPLSAPGEPEWVTPKLDKDWVPFLDGVMRRHLLKICMLREGEVTVQDWERAKRDGTRVIGFNGLRGVWEGCPQ